MQTPYFSPTTRFLANLTTNTKSITSETEMAILPAQSWEEPTTCTADAKKRLWPV